MQDVPGRDTRTATSSERRTWYGYGRLTRAEKSGFGRFLHDVTYIFGDISVLSMPALLYIAWTVGPESHETTAAGLVVWMAMLVVGSLIRGGWIRPLGTKTLGWVTVTPTLVSLRIPYYNAVLLGGSLGAASLIPTIGLWPALLVAAASGALATLLFPRLGESVARWRRPGPSA